MKRAILISIIQFCNLLFLFELFVSIFQSEFKSLSIKKKCICQFNHKHSMLPCRVSRYLLFDLLSAFFKIMSIILYFYSRFLISIKIYFSILKSLNKFLIISEICNSSKSANFDGKLNTIMILLLVSIYVHTKNYDY